MEALEPESPGHRVTGRPRAGWRRGGYRAVCRVALWLRFSVTRFPWWGLDPARRSGRRARAGPARTSSAAVIG
jgi:hypothetical protein